MAHRLHLPRQAARGAAVREVDVFLMALAWATGCGAAGEDGMDRVGLVLDAGEETAWAGTAEATLYGYDPDIMDIGADGLDTWTFPVDGFPHVEEIEVPDRLWERVGGGYEPLSEEEARFYVSVTLTADDPGVPGWSQVYPDTGLLDYEAPLPRRLIVEVVPAEAP